MSALRGLEAQKLAFSAREVAIERAGDHAEAVAAVSIGAGKQVMDLARGRIAIVLHRAGTMPDGPRATAQWTEDLVVIVDALLLVLAGTLAIGWRAAGVRAGAQRDRALGELGREARLERALREVAAAAAGEIGERELAVLVAARLQQLLAASTAAVIRADSDCLSIIGYSGPTPYPERLGWDEASSSARAVKTGGPARLED